MYNLLLRAAKKSSCDKPFQKYQTNLARTWQLINEIINKKTPKNKSSFSHIIVNNIKIEDPFTIANLFHEFCTSIAQTIADDIVPTDKPPDNFPTSPDDVIFYTSKEPVTHSEVYKTIKMLQKKKTPNMYGVSVFYI